MLRRLTRHPAFQAILARLCWLYLELVYRTTRWRLIGGENIDAAFAAHGTVIAAFWHETLPLMPQLWRTGKARAGIPAAHVLLSRSRDGRFIADVMRRFDLEMIHASSSKGGAAGMMAMARLLRTGAMMVITPDGPRGPRRSAALGVAQIAAISGKPVLPCAARLSFAIGLKSWDRMEVPLPFGRGVMVVGPALPVERHAAEARLPEITAALDAACEAADAALGRSRR